MLSRLMLKIRQEILVPGAYTFSLGTGRETPDLRLDFRASDISHEEGSMETGVGPGSEVHEADVGCVHGLHEANQSIS